MGDTLKGKKNQYTCDQCGGQFVTIDRDEGTTPFMTDCHVTEDCRGHSQSAFYRINQTLTPTFEWRRLSDAEAARESPASMQHHLMGGLFLRPLPGTTDPNDRASKAARQLIAGREAARHKRLEDHDVLVARGKAEPL